MRTLLIGGTDLTVAVADEMRRIGHSPCACVGIGSQFKISYAKAPVNNARHGDMGYWADQAGVPYLESTNTDEILTFAEEQNADFCLVAGWYHMIPKRLRDRFAKGVAGIHASMLPELRGGAPLNWAILSGLTKSGVTLFEMSDGVDDGPIYLQAPFDIAPRATIADLVRETHLSTLHLIGQALPGVASGAITPRKQVGTPTYGMQRAPEDGRIDWRSSAISIDRLIRAVGRPYPGATATLEGAEVKIWKAQPASEPTVYGASGQIARLPNFQTPAVVTADGLLVIEEATLADGADAMPLLMKSNNKRFAQG
jgi:methionyl-tRNA formyltransferase